MAPTRQQRRRAPGPSERGRTPLTATEKWEPTSSCILLYASAPLILACSGALVLVAHTLDGSFSLQVILNRWTGEELIPMTSEGCFGQTALMGRRREATYTARTPVRLMLI